MISSLLKPTDSAITVILLMMLIELALAFQSGNSDFEAHNVAKLLSHVVGRCITHFPRSGLICLMATSEFGHHVSHKFFIVVNVNRTVRMNHFVVPGGYASMSLLFTRVPVWRDVTLNTPEHYEYFVTILNLAPDRVGSRNMRDKDSLVALLDI